MLQCISTNPNDNDPRPGRQDKAQEPNTDECGHFDSLDWIDIDELSLGLDGLIFRDIQALLAWVICPLGVSMRG